MLPFLAIIAIIILKYQYNKIGRESIVERLDTSVQHYQAEAQIKNTLL